MSKTLTIRKAVSTDADILSSLAIRSKAHWGYSAEFLEACIEELSVLPADIESDEYCFEVAIVDGEVAGFYALEGLSGSAIELGALFVDPIHIGTGIGRTLIEKAKRQAASLGARTLIVQGDPNAEKFYRAAGGMLTGSRESESIAGRYLPTFQVSLASD